MRNIYLIFIVGVFIILVCCVAIKNSNTKKMLSRAQAEENKLIRTSDAGERLTVLGDNEVPVINVRVNRDLTGAEMFNGGEGEYYNVGLPRINNENDEQRASMPKMFKSSHGTTYISNLQEPAWRKYPMSVSCQGNTCQTDTTANSIHPKFSAWHQIRNHRSDVGDQYELLKRNNYLSMLWATT